MDNSYQFLNIGTQIRFNNLDNLNVPDLKCEFGNSFSGPQIIELESTAHFSLTTSITEPILKEIYFHDKRFIFNRPLLYKIEEEEDYFVMHSEDLDIVGTGRTPQEAYLSFAEEFQFVFERYSDISDEKISKRLRRIKSYLNSLVFDVA